ncbi:hypothetical protein BKA62DRAFT_767851 [Auriculariales sp. MPI-PUGE-AT-0066]|nr:hypothetical protein BKA62DRAFT_767851 [Auriculariales sp. MPI-PUGE-AT-0066]
MTATTYTRVLLVALALYAPSVVEARRCYYDSYGRYRCTSSLANGARIGIAIACAAVGLLLLLALLCCRRRAARRRNMAFVNQPQTTAPQSTFTGGPVHNNGQYAASPYAAGNQGHATGGPQFPQAAYSQNAAAPPYPGGNYAAPSGAPPTTGAYAPPPGPPPVTKQ